jgi:DNA 3'-phosphatase
METSVLTPISTTTGWNVYTDIDVMTYEFGHCNPSNRLVVFDFESALVRTKSGHRYPVDGNDWILANEGIPDSLSKLVTEKNHRFVILSNQFGANCGLYTLSSIKGRVEGLVKRIGIPCVAMISLSPNQYSKPSLELLSLFSVVFNSNIELQRLPSLVVAHRHANGGTDVNFASAAGFTFCSTGHFCGWSTNPVLKSLMNKV